MCDDATKVSNSLILSPTPFSGCLYLYNDNMDCNKTSLFEVYIQMCSPCALCHTSPNVVLSTVVNKCTNSIPYVCMHVQLLYIHH